MNGINKKENKILLIYQRILGIAAIFIFVTNLHLYLFQIKAIPFPPYFFVIGFFLFSIPLVFLKARYLPGLVLQWCGLYIAISSFSFLFVVRVDQIASQELQFRIFTTLFFLVAIIVFSGNYIHQLWIRRALLAGLIFNTFNIINDAFNPALYNNNTQRPAGFFLNPNLAAYSLILALILSITILPKKYRFFCAIFVAIGVLFSFSRGAALCLLIAIIMMLKYKIIPRKQLLGILGIFISLLIYLSFINTSLELQNLLVSTFRENLGDRIEWLFGAKDTHVGSDDSRAEIVKLGLKEFYEAPILGKGIGYTKKLAQITTIGISTHNMYLLFLVEHGFLGIVIMPLLVLSITNKSQNETQKIGFIFAIFILLWSLFTHNILEQRFSIVTIALMAAMTMNSQQKRIKKQNKQSKVYIIKK